MFRTGKYLLCVLIYALSGVNGGKEMCDLSDDKCVFKAANIAYPKMIAGIPGMEPSDPLHKDEILINLPRFSYKLHNVTMTGLKDYYFNFVKFYKNGTYISETVIPVTKIEAHYELHGQLDPMVLNGKGVCRLTYNRHKIHFIGQSLSSKDKIDKKLHAFLGNFTFPSHVMGTKVIDYENLTNLNKELTEDELEILDDAVHNQVITELLNKHVDNVDDYLRIIPFSEVLAKPNQYFPYFLFLTLFLNGRTINF